MKWFTRKTFCPIIIAFLIPIVAGKILTSNHGKLSTEAFFLKSDDVPSMVKESAVSDEFKLPVTATIEENSDKEETSPSQLMPFFYVGDTDQPESEKSSVSNIVPAIRQKRIGSDREKKIVSKSTSRQFQSPLAVKALQKSKLVSNIPVLVPNSVTSNIETRRVFNDNEAPFVSNIDSPKPASFKLLWYIQPTSSPSFTDSPSPSSSSLIQSFPFTSARASRSAYDPDYVPLFKYNSMVSKPPLPAQSKSYYNSNYQSPASFYNHYQSIYHPTSLSYPSFPQFSSNSDDDDDDDDDSKSENTRSFYAAPFSLPVPTISTSSFSPSGLNHYFGKPYGSPMRRQYGGKSAKTAAFIHASKDILQDPDIEQLLTSFDIERDIGKDKHYRPRKSYDEMSMNGKYSDNSGSRSKSFDSFSDPFMSSPESNTGRYGGRSDFKPYFGYYKGFQISPYKAKGFNKLPNERFNMDKHRNNFSRNMKPF
ncbi:uncharacterized protein LOC107360683 [Tetranychus urticae]|uniref:Uncharacterized protein n=1 Tax=Tetranychus urticae TaxID=32264 RepID=T1K4A4_TETUR|nr:uncharacterized protein LOC107360683 [Tetranychus urticae]